MKVVRSLAFIIMSIIIISMMSGTVIEKFFGTNVAVEFVYTSPWMLLLWAILSVCGLAYLFFYKRQCWSVRLLHLSFVVILLGASFTHFMGKRGSVHLRLGEASQQHYQMEGNTVGEFPFTISLNSFGIDYYDGTQAAKDYICSLDFVAEDGDKSQQTVSMNNIARFKNYRFYEQKFDSDQKGVTLLVCHDPIGIELTYDGYILFLLSCLLMLLNSKSQWRGSLRMLRKSQWLLLLCFVFAAGSASGAPRTLQKPLAANFGKLYVYHNDRVCPMQTFARDFCISLTGKTSYQGLTAEQVLTGWLFFYEDWKNEPMIKVKGENVRKALGIKGEYAALTDFIRAGEYKLQPLLTDMTNRNAMSANAKFDLISSVSMGSAFRIYPFTGNENGGVEWISWTSKMPANMNVNDWKFVRGSMEYVGQMIYTGHNIAANEGLTRIRQYQEEKSKGSLPSATRFDAEILYNKMCNLTPWMALSFIMGIAGFCLTILSLTRKNKNYKVLHYAQIATAAIILAYLTFIIVLRGFVANHAPLSNGYETMLFMSWCSVLVSLIFRRVNAILPFGLLTTGLTLLVAGLSEEGAQISFLMPVLSSPLLSIHVVIIMLAYVLLSFTMMCSCMALIINGFWKDVDARAQNVTALQDLSKVLLYPAVMLLGIGIFVGAVWANISWGRYWGWDPKEVWALITMLVYAIALHPQSIPFFRSPLKYHIYVLLSFFSVIITYFGVNFFLNGMHSYA